MDRANEQRFHLSFHYWNEERGHKNSGSQVVFADDIETAARRIARERGLSRIHVDKRYHANGRIDEINLEFCW